MGKRCSVTEKEMSELPHWSHASNQQRVWLYCYNANAVDWLLHGDSWTRRMMRYYFNKFKGVKDLQDCPSYICGLSDSEKDCAGCEMSCRDSYHFFISDDNLPF
jgi:hypothetical protein